MRSSRHVFLFPVTLIVLFICQFSFAEKAKQSPKKKQALTKIELVDKALIFRSPVGWEKVFCS